MGEHKDNFFDELKGKVNKTQNHRAWQRAQAKEWRERDQRQRVARETSEKSAQAAIRQRLGELWAGCDKDVFMEAQEKIRAIPQQTANLLTEKKAPASRRAYFTGRTIMAAVINPVRSLWTLESEYSVPGKTYRASFGGTQMEGQSEEIVLGGWGLDASGQEYEVGGTPKNPRVYLKKEPIYINHSQTGNQKWLGEPISRPSPTSIQYLLRVARAGLQEEYAGALYHDAKIPYTNLAFTVLELGDPGIKPSGFDYDAFSEKKA